MPPGSRKGRAEWRERFQGPWLPASPPLRPAGSPGPWLPSTTPVPTQSSACTLTSVISGKFSRLLQALEMQRDLALRDIEVAKTQALEQARDEKQRLQGHLEALSCCDHRIRNLLEQLDDRTFLQVPGLGAAGWGTSVPAPRAPAYCSCPRGSGITAPGAPRPSRATDSPTLGRRSAAWWPEGVTEPAVCPPPGRGGPPRSTSRGC